MPISNKNLHLVLASFKLVVPSDSILNTQIEYPGVTGEAMLATKFGAKFRSDLFDFLYDDILEGMLESHFISGFPELRKKYDDLPQNILEIICKDLGSLLKAIFPPHDDQLSWKDYLAIRSKGPAIETWLRFIDNLETSIRQQITDLGLVRSAIGADDIYRQNWLVDGSNVFPIDFETVIPEDLEKTHFNYFQIVSYFNGELHNFANLIPATYSLKPSNKVIRAIQRLDLARLKQINNENGTPFTEEELEIIDKNFSLVVSLMKNY